MRHTDVERVEDWVPGRLLAGLRPELATHAVHLAGGAVRDRLLGRVVADFDLVSDGAADALGRRLADRLGGRFVALAAERFASYRIVAGDLVVDLWGRGETSIHDELERRDLTINALAIDLSTRRLLDPFAGLADLEARVLRATTERSFLDDPLRVLRLARLGAELAGFSAETGTLALARRAAELVGQVAAERVRGEVDRLLAADGAAGGIATLAACGLYPRLWGGAAATGVEAVIPRIAAVQAIRDTEEIDHELVELDAATLCQAVLFLPPGGGVAAAATSELLTRRSRPRVTRLLQLEALPVDEPTARWFLRRWGRRWGEAMIFSLARDAGSPATREAAGRLSEVARRHGREILDLPILLDGTAVGRLLDLKPGAEVGRALTALEREQVAGRVRTPEEARAFLLDRSRR